MLLPKALLSWQRMEVTIDRSGRIALPKRLRDKLDLAQGAVLRIEEHAEGILLRPIGAVPMTAVRDGVLVYIGEAEGDLDKAIQRQRRERLSHVATGRRT